MSEVTEALKLVEFPEKLGRFSQRFQTFEEVWAECPRVDWMFWMIETFQRGSKKGLRLFICHCARRWWAFMPDARSRRAVEAAEMYVRGEATLGALDFVRDGAIRAAQEALEQTKPITARAARLAVLALEIDILPAAKEASELAVDTGHAINETNSDAKQLMIMEEQAMFLREAMSNPFGSQPQQQAPQAQPVRDGSPHSSAA